MEGGPYPPADLDRIADFDRGSKSRGGSKSAAHREITFELTRATVKEFLSDIISLLHRIENFSIKKTK